MRRRNLNVYKEHKSIRSWINLSSFVPLPRRRLPLLMFHQSDHSFSGDDVNKTEEGFAHHTYSGGSGILASILVLLLQGSYVLTIPSKLKHDSKKKERKKKEENWRKKFRAKSRLPKIEEI